jgi:hypothetical protein
MTGAAGEAEVPVPALEHVDDGLRVCVSDDRAKKSYARMQLALLKTNFLVEA